MFTADVLFKGTVGGTAGGGPTGFADLRHSIMERLMTLDPARACTPATPLPTTIGEEWESQPVHPRLARADAEGASRARAPASRPRWCCGRPTTTAPTRPGCAIPDGREARSSAAPRWSDEGLAGGEDGRGVAALDPKLWNEWAREPDFGNSWHWLGDHLGITGFGVDAEQPTPAAT